MTKKDAFIPSFSVLGSRWSRRSGILELMDDLGHALDRPEKVVAMMGGGNPAHIPEVERWWCDRWQELGRRPERLAKVLGDYDPPQGNPEFLTLVAEFFRAHYGWPITEKNVAITPGGQVAFFYLLNLFAGKMGDGSSKKILFPLTPEYIGYANQGLSGEFFLSQKPRIEQLPSHRFKYHVDFENLAIDDEMGALCLSRPTNPSGNVVSDDELQRLIALTGRQGVPLLIDNAYGAPFPHALFVPAQLFWEEHMIHVFSLSKLGLPGTRTAIIVAAEPIVEAISAMHAVSGLANTNIGQVMVVELLREQKLGALAREFIAPFYAQRSQRAVEIIHEQFQGFTDYAIHASEGAFFLWLWFPQLKITTRELYQRLKARGVIIVPGEYFFYGMEREWPHRHQCIRLSFVQEPEVLQRGIAILAEEVMRASK